MNNSDTQNLAERIALLLQDNEQGNSDFAFLRSSLEKINQRLDTLETKFDSKNTNDFSPLSFARHSSKIHPSQEKFEIAEAVEPEAPENFETEKPCPYEPTGKPCDHCSMCGSRGF